MDIVVGALRSSEGEAAVRAAGDEAVLRGGRVRLVAHVATALDQQASRRFEQDRRSAEAAAEELAGSVRQRGVEVIVHVPVGANSPAEAILEVAQEHDAELIVIGVRRRSRVGKLVLGSNAQDILLASDAPVLAVKPRDDDSQG